MAKPAWHHDKRTRQARGYGVEWSRLRLLVLKRDGHQCRCEDCEKDGTLKAATHVDHRISKANWLKRFGNLDGVDDPTNLRAINAVCHDRKSIAEKGYTVKAGADVSGMPLDPSHPWYRGGREGAGGG